MPFNNHSFHIRQYTPLIYSESYQGTLSKISKYQVETILNIGEKENDTVIIRL